MSESSPFKAIELQPSAEVLYPLHYGELSRLKYLAVQCSRTSHRSDKFDKESVESDESVSRFLHKWGSIHPATLEFIDIHVRYTTSRALANEITRHRLFVYMQESTRYVNYRLKPVGFIKPWGTPDSVDWLSMAQTSYNHYLELMDSGLDRQSARDALPLNLATVLIQKGNLRAWREFFQKRLIPQAHPALVSLLKPLYEHFCKMFPELDWPGLPESIRDL